MSLITPERDVVTPVLPAGFAPMLATAADGPLDSRDYAYEVKWDGMRVLIGLDGDHTTYRTRNKIEAVDRFPELAVLRSMVRPRKAVFDAEVVSLVNGVPNFGALQHRIHASNPHDIRRLAAEEPVALIIFDMLREEDEWLVDLPWEERRKRLEAAVTPGPFVQLSLVCPDGRTLWESVCAMGLEGVMAKRRNAKYEAGRRSPAWLKIKCQKTVDLVVGGWSEGSGSRSSALGALILGMYDASDRLVFVGRVGSGFDQQGLVDSLKAIRQLEIPESPFYGPADSSTRPHWMRPELVCEVRFQNWTLDRKIRFPIFLRWRPDKIATEIRLDDQ